MSKPAETILKTCRLCACKGAFPLHDAQERMFGSLAHFAYFQCTACGTLQIENVPAELDLYYPQNYYTYHTGRQHRFKNWFRQQRNRALLNDGPAKIMTYIQPFEALASLASLPLSRHSRILDVGAGQGVLVKALKELGYKNVLGIDPLADPRNQMVQSCKIEALDLRPWDLIMFHHSLEHVPDPGKLLAAAYQRLAPHGQILIRVPLVDSYAFEKYQQYWVQWDAPRHLYLFSRQGIQLLAQAHNLSIRWHWDDSTAFQFWASERYGKGLDLQDPLSLRERLKLPLWKHRATQLNRLGSGDQGVFLLQK